MFGPEMIMALIRWSQWVGKKEVVRFKTSSILKVGLTQLVDGLDVRV